MEKGHEKNTFISSSILIALSVVALSFLLYVGYLLFVNNILPLAYRIIFLILGGIFNIVFLWMGASEGGLVKKIAGIFFVSIMIFVLLVGMQYIKIGLYTLSQIQAQPSSQKSDSMQSFPEKTPDVEAIDVDVSKQGFALYLSGIDTFGEVDVESRSDVNIVVAIHPINHQILMVSVPRDSYLPIAEEGNWEYDKLTHAGLYGISASVKTLESALNIPINYYVKLNFDSFLTVIDALDGIDLENPYAFTSDDGIYYPEGPISLNSQEALSYVRERYGLPNGDFGRQQHQAMVIQAVFEKLQSPQFFFKFQGIMLAVQDSIQTNMPQNAILTFFNDQVSGNEGWTFETAVIEGYDETGLPSYALPDSDLYFFVPYEESLAEVGVRMQAVLEGTYTPSEGEEFSDQQEELSDQQ